MNRCDFLKTVRAIEVLADLMSQTAENSVWPWDMAVKCKLTYKNKLLYSSLLIKVGGNALAITAVIYQVLVLY